MDNFKHNKKLYADRIKRFTWCLERRDPDWIKRRLWFEDLKKFSLEKYFKKEVFYAKVSDPEDKTDFYDKVIQASIDIDIERMGNEIESGFEIEEDITDDIENNEHESLLGYLWWTTIYKMCLKAERFSEEEKEELKEKYNSFKKEIRLIESLSY